MDSRLHIDLIELLASFGVPPVALAVLLLLRLALELTHHTPLLRYAHEQLRFGDHHRCRFLGVRMPNRALNVRHEWPYGTLLARLDRDAQARLLRIGVRRQVEAGQILIHEGSRDSHLILLESGLTKVTAQMPDGRTALLAIRMGGDLLGEMSALNSRPRSATVTTCGPTRYSVISKDRFKGFLKEHPDAAVELAAMVADRLRWSNRRRIDFTSYPVKIRVARVIAELARTHGYHTTNGIVINVRLIQPELATICGAAETTTQKALRDLRAKGLVETDYRRITIRDLDALREAGRLDPEL